MKTIAVLIAVIFWTNIFGQNLSNSDFRKGRNHVIAGSIATTGGALLVGLHKKLPIEKTVTSESGDYIIYSKNKRMICTGSIMLGMGVGMNIYGIIKMLRNKTPQSSARKIEVEYYGTAASLSVTF
jgi:hypothetical protein